MAKISPGRVRAHAISRLIDLLRPGRPLLHTSVGSRPQALTIHALPGLVLTSGSVFRLWSAYLGGGPPIERKLTGFGSLTLLLHELQPVPQPVFARAKKTR